MSEKDGGPAFPCDYLRREPSLDRYQGGNAAYVKVTTTGLSLRDYFASCSLAAMMSKPMIEAQSWSDVAAVAYAIADEMLKERAK